jgi:hypothetical protein
MSMSLTVYLSVADAARDVVLLHVSSSSERQERKNETGAMKKRTEHLLVTKCKAVTPLSYSFIQ